MTSRPPRRRSLLGFLLSLALAATCGSCQRAGTQPIRLVLITVDTLRYDSFAGGTTPPSAMPLTRARAARCLIFDRFFAATSITTPTHATLMTGLHPWQHSVTRNGMALAAEHTTLAQRLREAGFETAAVVASVPVSSAFGFARGFDGFREDFSHVLKPGTNRRYYSLAETITRQALEILDRASDSKKLFLWLHYFDPHAPYGDSRPGPTLRPMEVVRSVVDGQVDRETAIRQARELYDQDVAHLDRSLERMFQRLASDADRVATHLLLTADHGESFGEDDSMAHGRRLTQGQIHVPTFLCSPRVEPGVRGDVAGSIDVAPTLLSLAGVPPTPALARAPALGAVAARDLTRPPPGPTRAFGMKTTYPYQELRLDGRTYDLSFNLFYMIDHDGRLYRGNGERLLDPASTEDGERLESLFGSFERQLATGQAETLSDPEIQGALQALGYLQ